MLDLRNCRRISDNGMAVVANKCPGLTVVKLTNTGTLQLSFTKISKVKKLFGILKIFF